MHIRTYTHAHACMHARTCGQVLSNGAASAVAYFTFPSLGRHAMAYAAGTCAAVAIVGYVAAEVAIQRTPGGRANRRVVDPA